MNLTSEQRKWMWIAAAVIVFWYFVRPMIFYAMQIAAFQQQQTARAAQRRQAKPAGPTPATLGVPLNKLLGIWEGKTAIEGRGNCALKFELRQAPDVRLSGFSTLNCQPLRGNAGPADRNRNPQRRGG